MDSPTQSPRRRKGILRRCERVCWWIFIRIPLVLVYSLTTWAVWVSYNLCMVWRETSNEGNVFAALVVAFYVMLNWTYTVTAFTDPGSPLNPPGTKPTQHAYSELPTREIESFASGITVKSDGKERFCKKCQTRKPDRTHHCSTCRRCVLKMDHHCPWIATCVGLRNYKSFVLFCTYVTLFCWTCLAITGSQLYKEYADFKPGQSNLSVNMVLVAILAGIFGLVMTGFTGWHYYLALNNQTTIERLEKTRYLGTLQKHLRSDHRSTGGSEESEGLMHKYGEQIRELHANAIPGITRVEEGEERASPTNRSRYSAPSASRSDMDWQEAQKERERQRYESYLDEQDSESLPNAFDLGWKRNLRMLFGSNPLFWPFPIGTETGDGFQWVPNPAWVRAREEARQRREVQWKEQESRERRAGWGSGARYPVVNNTRALDETQMEDGDYLVTSGGLATIPGKGRRSPMKADRLLGRVGMYADDVPLQTIRKEMRDQDHDDTASLDGIYDGGGDDDNDGDEVAAV